MPSSSLSLQIKQDEQRLKAEQLGQDGPLYKPYWDAVADMFSCVYTFCLKMTIA